MNGKKAVIIGLWKDGPSVSSISKLLSAQRRSPYYTINRYKQLGTFCDRPKCGRLRSADTLTNTNKIRSRI